MSAKLLSLLNGSMCPDGLMEVSRKEYAGTDVPNDLIRDDSGHAFHSRLWNVFCFGKFCNEVNPAMC